MKLSGSLVLYHNSAELYELAIQSFLNGCDGVLYVVDNSSSPLKHDLFQHPRIRYIFNNANLGFGVAHNRAILNVCNESDYHIIINPDINFCEGVIPHLIDVMQKNSDIGVLMPRVNYPDGSLQRLSKLLPSPVDLILRRFLPLKALKNLINRRYELHDLPQTSLVDVPSISGCFLMVRTKLFERIGVFDSRYFMYLEDVDLVRRIGSVARVSYDPRISITHTYAKGSYYNKKLLRYHITSAINYFNKWGWWVDVDRVKRNSAILSHIDRLKK